MVLSWQYNDFEQANKCIFAGASLSEPHTSEMNGGFFIYMYLSHVFRMSIRLITHHVQTISKKKLLCRLLSSTSSVGKDGEERRLGEVAGA